MPRSLTCKSLFFIFYFVHLTETRLSPKATAQKMSGLEVLGVLASASQLTDYCVMIIASLHDIYRLAHGKSNRYRRQLEQVQQLIETAQLVKATETFHTPSIENQLDSILVEARRLQRILDGIVSESGRKSKKVYLKAVFNNYHEREMHKGFASLNDKKSTLTLCIVSTYGAFLLEIRNGTAEELPIVRRKVDQIDKALQNFPDILSEIAKIQDQISDVTENLASMQVSHGNISNRAPCGEGGSSGLRSRAPEPQALVNFEPHFDASNGSVYSIPTPSSGTRSPTIIPLEQNQHVGFPNKRSLTTYSNVCSVDNSYQLNGNIGGNFSNVLVRKHYEGITARHNSRQINGDIIDPSFALKFFQS